MSAVAQLLGMTPAAVLQMQSLLQQATLRGCLSDVAQLSAARMAARYTAVRAQVASLSTAAQHATMLFQVTAAMLDRVALMQLTAAAIPE